MMSKKIIVFKTILLIEERSVGNWSWEFSTVISCCCSKQCMLVTGKTAPSSHLKTWKLNFLLLKNPQ